MLRDIIVKKFNEALEQTNSDQSYSTLSDDLILLESGLDSLGFAVLVALLEDELGYDPFQLSDTAVYPRTFGEFHQMYKQYAPK